MYYIVFDLEFNQDFTLPIEQGHKASYPFEIIQIGALKLDSKLNTVAHFNRYVKPTIYHTINPSITELTGITTEQLGQEDTFPGIFNDLIQFIHPDDICCTWGMSDIKELFKTMNYFQLGQNLFPKRYINIQPYVSIHFHLSTNKLLRLQKAVEMFDIPITYRFHDAYHDAFYTAEVMKKIYYPSIQIELYDPNYVKIKPRQQKQIIDYDSLIQQFDKMYGRQMTQEEQDIIKLAFKMGKTHQFLKQVPTP